MSGAGALAVGREAEGTGLVWPREEKVSGLESAQCLQKYYWEDKSELLTGSAWQEAVDIKWKNVF